MQAATASPPKSTPRPIRAVRWTRLLLHVAQGLLVTTLIYPRVAPHVRGRITQAWAQKLLRILRISLAVHGAAPSPVAPDEKPKRFIVSNHVSWLDIFVINAAEPSRFVAKSEIRDWPIAGWLVESAGTIFVHRSKRSDTARINREIHDALEQGDTVAIFPEGTTTAGDRLLKFHTALFEPAVVNTAHILPLALRYRSAMGEQTETASFVGETTFAQSVGRIIATRQMIADITFAPAIDTESVASKAMSRRDAALAAEDAIAAILNVPKPHQHQRFHEGATPLAAQPTV